MRRTLLLLTLVSLALPGAAAAAPEDDFNAIYRDWTGADGSAASDVRSCQWSREQLVNAKNVAQGVNDFNYYGEFISEVDVEIGRWDSGYCAGVAPDPGGGSSDPQGDFKRVFDDWAADGTITPCRFTRPQLVSALNVAAQLGDFDAYAPGFRDAVRREIERIDRGECAGVGVGARLTIARIKPRPRRKLMESVTIKNRGAKAAQLRGTSLRDKQGKRIRLPRYRLKPGRSLRVFTGCLGTSRKPRRQGARFYACKRREVWDDKGDVVKLTNSKRTVLAQRGYGRFRSVPRF